MKPDFSRTPYPLWPPKGIPLYLLTPHIPQDLQMWLVSVLFLIVTSRNILRHLPGTKKKKSHVLLKNMSFYSSSLSLSSWSDLSTALYTSLLINIFSIWFTSYSPLQALPSVIQVDNPTSPKTLLMVQT